MKLNKLRENKVLSEVIFYVSVLFIAGFYLAYTFLNSWLYLIGAIVGVLGLIFYFVLNPINFKGMFSNKAAKKSTYTGLKIFLVIVILSFTYIILNGKLPKIDLSSSNIYSLSKKSKEIVKKIDSPLYIKYFVSTSAEATQDVETVENLLDAYHKLNKKIDVQYVDPDINPLEAKKYNITQRNTIVMLYKNKRKELYPWDFYEVKSAQDQSTRSFIGEKIITSAIEYLLTEEGKKVYFVLGHKEKYINDYQNEGYSSIKTMLEKQGRKAININLLEKGEIPSDCSVLVIPAPQTNYSDKEIKIINDYIAKGGKFILITDANLKSNIYDDILSKFNITRLPGIVVDDKNYYASLSVASPVVDLNYHKITEKIQENNLRILTLIPDPIIAKLIPDEKKGIRIISLAQTKNTAWNEILDKKDVNSNKKIEIKFNKDKGEKKGVKQIALLIQKDNNKEQYESIGAVFADSNMFENEMLNLPLGNDKLFENTINELIGDDILLDISGKIIKEHKITLTNKDKKILSNSSFIIIPIGLILIIFAISRISFRRKKEVEEENS